MNVYACEDDCKSELGKKMQRSRADRPSEWMMDEFIGDAEAMSERIHKLEFMVENGLGWEDLQREV